MIYGLNFLCDILSDFNPTLIINSREISDNCRRFKFYESSQEYYDPDCVYLLVDCEKAFVDFKQIEASFLCFGKAVTVDGMANFLFVPEDCDRSVIIKKVSLVFEVFSIFRNIEGNLLKALLNDDSLETYLNIGSELLHNPIALCDLSDDRVIAYSYTVVTNDAVWDEIVYGQTNITKSEFLHYPSSLSESFSMKSFFGSLRNPYAFKMEGYEKNRFISGVWIEDECQYVLLGIENEKTFQEIDFILVQYFCKMLADILKKKTKESSKNKDTLFSFLHNIFCDKLDDRMILRKAHTLGIDFAKNGYLISIFHENQQVNYLDAMEIQEIVKKTNRFSRIIIYNLNVLILEDSSPSDMEKHLQELQRIISQKKWKVAVSLPFSSPLGLKRAYEECLAAAKYGVHIQPDNFLYLYKYFISLHLCEEISSHINIRNYILPCAYQMIDYDKEKGTLYTETLYRYLKCYKNKDAVARLLNIHFNTLNYRLKRITELFSIDFDDNVELKALEYSLDLIISNTSSYSFSN